MKSIHIRNVPEDTLMALKKLAKREKRSLQQQLQWILEEVASQNPPIGSDEDIKLITVSTGGKGTWQREEIYESDSGR